MRVFKHAFDSWKQAILTVAGLSFLLWMAPVSAQAQRSYFNHKIPMEAELRFDQCFEDLTASWISAYIDSLETVGKEKGGEPYLCMAHMLQAYQYYLSDDSLNFFKKSEQALEESKSLGASSLYYNLLSNEVAFYTDHRNAFKAQKTAELIIEEARESNDHNSITTGYLSLGVLHAGQANFKNSIECYEQVLKYLEEVDDNDNIMKSQMHYYIGENYYHLSLYRKALKSMEQSISLLPSMNRAYLIQALCYFKMGDYATFLKLFANVKKRENQEFADTDIYTYAKAMEQALTRNYTQAEATVQQIKDKAQRYFALSDIHVLRNEWSQAFSMFRLANAAQDSMRQENFSDLLASADREINTAYKLYEKDEELRKNRSQILIFGCIFIILLVVSLACVFYYYKRNQWQKNRIHMIQRYNAELSKAKEKAEEANRMKTMFLQNMSHDLRTPLNAIVGFSQLLGLPDGFNSDEDKEKYNSYIANNSEMLMLLFEDILNLGDIEKGNFKVEYTPTPCNDLCRKILKCVEYRVPPGVALNFTSNVDEQFSLSTDGRRVQQVLVNFLTNACKHTREGEIRLHCQVSEPENSITFSVIDTGEGVAEDLKDTLFERYVKRGENDSHGLGLNICQTIATKMGGTVSLDKSYTTGAKFDFKLKLG